MNPFNQILHSYKLFDEMTPYDLELERKQKWLIKKSDCVWWIYRNDAAFVPVHSEARGVEILTQYGITNAVDLSQRATTDADWAAFRRDKMRLMNGKGPSVARRVWRWLGGDAA